MADYTGALSGQNGNLEEVAQITENVMAILCNRGRLDSYENFKSAVLLAYPMIEQDLKKYQEIYVEETTDVLKDFLKAANYVFTFFTHNDDTYVQLTVDFNSVYGELVYAIMPIKQELVVLKRDGMKYELKNGDAEFVYYHYARITFTILQMIKLLHNTIMHDGESRKVSVKDLYDKFVLEGGELANAVLNFGGSDLDVCKFLGYFKDVFEAKTLDSVEMNFPKYERLKIATEMDFIYSILSLSATGNKLLSRVAGHVSAILMDTGIVAPFDLNISNIKAILARRPDFFTAGDKVYAIHALMPACVLSTQDECDAISYIVDKEFKRYLGENELLEIDHCEEILLENLPVDFKTKLSQVEKSRIRDLVVARLYSQSKLFTFKDYYFRLRTSAAWDMTCINVKHMPGKLPAMHLLFDQWSRSLKSGLRVGKVVSVGIDAGIIQADFNENDIFPNFSCFCHISFTHINEARVSCLTKYISVDEEVTFKLGLARTDTPTLQFFCYVENIEKEKSTRGIKRKLDSPDSKKEKPDKFAKETVNVSSDSNDTSIDSEPSHPAAESTADKALEIPLVMLSSDESEPKDTQENSPDISMCAVVSESSGNTSTISEPEVGPEPMAVVRQLEVPEQVAVDERQLDEIEPMAVNLPVESSGSDESSMSSSTQGL